MKTVGIITELNPFHSGHAHLIREAGRLSGADFVITVMSGDFVQRGEPAIFDKYKRTKMALAGGADMVFELPVRFCLSSAGDFALGAVLALSSLGFVNELYFGSECGSLKPLEKAASLLYEEYKGRNSAFSHSLQMALGSGLSYPAARLQALTEADPSLQDIVKEPNNILGTEYCLAIKKLHSPLIPHTIPRDGQHYHDPSTAASEDGTHAHPSASAVRRQICQKNIPHLEFSDCSAVIGHTLLKERDLSAYKDISPDLAARIKKLSDTFRDAPSFAADCQTRAFTESRIRRALLQCAMGLRETSLSMPYLRLLGLNKKAGALLRSTPVKTKIITKLSASVKELDDSSLALLSQDLLASDWYRQMWQQKYSVLLPNEYRRSVLIC